MRISDVIGLPTYLPADTRAQLLELSAVKEHGVTVTGYVMRVRRMDDGGYHLQLTGLGGLLPGTRHHGPASSPS